MFCIMNNIDKEGNFSNDVAKEMEFCLCDGGYYSEYTGAGFVEILQGTLYTNTIAKTRAKQH